MTIKKMFKITTTSHKESKDSKRIAAHLLLQGKEGDGNKLVTIMPRGTIPHYSEAI
jgi:hypothetical protein